MNSTLKFIILTAIMPALTMAAEISAGNYARKIEISLADGVKTALGSEGIAGIPVLVRLSTAITDFKYSDFKGTLGGDLRFALGDGTLLSSEVDVWDEAGTSLVWVKVPNLAAETKLIAYYGSTNPDAMTPADVWSDYAGVWHMNEASGDALDATGHGLAGVPSGTKTSDMVAGEGVVGSARINQTSAGKFNGIKVPNYNDYISTASEFSIGAWFISTSMSGYPRPFSRKTSYGNTTGFEVEFSNGSKTASKVCGSSSLQVAYTTPDMTAGWTHLLYVFDGTTVTIYTNGFKTASGTVVAVAARTENLTIGNNIGITEQGWCGRYDEVRLYNGVCDAKHAEIEVRAQRDAEFFSYGASEPVDADAPAMESASIARVNDDFVVSVIETAGNGRIYVDCIDVSGTNTQELTTSDTDYPKTYSVSLSGLAANRTYSVMVRAVTDKTTVKCPGISLYNGQLAVASSGTAHEQGFKSADFILTRADSDFELSASYVMSGSAVNGRTYRSLPGVVTFAKGETEVRVSVCPLPDPVAQTDVAAVLTSASNSVPASASMTIVNDESVAGTTIFVAPSGNDENDGSLYGSAKATVSAAVAALGASDGNIYLERGTYAETNATLFTDDDASGLSSVILTNAIKVIGLTGNPADVIVKRVSSSNFRLFALNHTGARLRYITVRDGTINDSSTLTQLGGNVVIGSNGGTIEDCVLIGGHAGQWPAGGGNVGMRAGRVVRCTLTDGTCNPNGPRAGRRCGSNLCMQGGIVENSLITKGVDGYGPVAMYESSTMVNCTIAGNSGTLSAGVGILDSSKKQRVINCVIAGNSCSEDSSGKGTVYMSYWPDDASVSDASMAIAAQAFSNCVAEIAINDNCIVGKPFFKDAAKCDYSIRTISAALDAGADYSSTAAISTTDLAGNSRESGSSVDAGAYEFDQSSFVFDYEIALRSTHWPTAADCYARAVGTTGTVTYSWDLNGDDTAELTTNATAFVWNPFPVGAKAVTVSATDAEKTVKSEKTTNLKSVPWVIYTSPKNSGAAEPYDTPETAATDIQTAVTYALDDTTIRVLPTTYTVSSQITVDKAVRIEGSTGDPKDVIVQGNGGVVRPFYLNNASAVVCNLTITKGYVQQNQGSNVYIADNGGMVSNCVISSGYAWNYYSGAGIKMTGVDAVVTHCDIFGNSINQDHEGQGVVAVDVVRGLLANSYIHGNYCSAAGYAIVIARNDASHIENCTVVSNYAKTAAGIVANNKSTVKNCVIFDCLKDGDTTAVADRVINPWSGIAANFTNCATDGAAAINDTCKIITPTAFRDYANGDWRPSAGGGLIDAGVTLSGQSAGVDLLGKPRVMGKSVDIGCYEASVGGLRIIVR